MSKRNTYIIGLFLLLCCPLHSWSKITIKYEYWIDNNRVGTVSGEADDGVNQNLQIDVGDLSPGVHFYNVRAKYGNTGKWSTVYRTLFTIPFQAEDGESANLQQYEYWIDNDYDGRVTSDCADGDTPSLSIDVSNLTAGVHFFNVRAQHADGTWGTINRTQFSIPTTTDGGGGDLLQQYEYWIDNDYERRVITAYTDGEQAPELNIDVSSLTPGVHFYNVRVLDGNGVWSDVDRRLFTIPYPAQEVTDKSITSYQYTFQSDDYVFSTVSKSVTATEELVLNEEITVDLPESTPTVDDNCKFTFNADVSEATMIRSVNLRFLLGCQGVDGAMGVPAFYDDIVYTTSNIYEWLEMTVGERLYDLPPQSEEPLSIVHFTISQEMTYKVSSDTRCNLRIYKSDGTLFGQSDGQALVNGWRCHLSAGSYYAVVFGNDDVASLMVEELHIPAITFDDEYVEILILTQTDWDKNDNGELDEEEAAVVTDLGELFKGNTDITMFNELSYFTGLTSISANVFQGCTNLKAITLPANVTSIGTNAFRNCSALTTINIPTNVAEIDEDAYIGCSALTAITVATDNTVFDSRENSNAIIVKKSNTLLIGCQNTVIPEDVEAIAANAFYGCTGLTALTIPASVTSIGSYAFRNCSNLTEVHVKNETPVKLATYTFTARRNAKLYVPEGCSDAYKDSDYWKDFMEIVEEMEIIKGDLNGDGKISITDVVAIINVIAGNTTDPKKVAAADVNGDGKVSITDCVAAINLMATQQTDSPCMVLAPMMSVDESDTNDYISAAVYDNRLTVSLDNKNRFTAFQMVVNMPEGMTLSKGQMDNARSEDHQLMVREMGNGQYLVVGFSPSNGVFTGNSGRLFSIATMGQSYGDIVISDVEFATADAEAYYLAEVTLSGSLTDITETRFSDALGYETIYDLHGRQLAKGQLNKGLYIINGKKVNIKK